MGLAPTKSYEDLLGDGLEALLQKGIKPETVKNTEAALNAALDEIPKPRKGFELDHLDEIEKLVREQEKG